MGGDDQVVLVNARDEVTGTMEKLQAHREGALHRAVSVVITNARGQMLLQRRAWGKYHSPGLWANAACTHPYLDEDPAIAAQRRLWQEMGLRAELEPLFTFTYRAELDRGLIEHELDHVFQGVTDQDPRPDPAEVAAFRWVSPSILRAEMRRDPDCFAPWFLMIARRMGDG
ncbi:isopentenyl-diphosphate delta-isomerase [bacterium DOLJORAL78_65_58]|nr:MAG: isopentenyl-diphosphate delta-isomerase [bacterium DOLZORAL124_64_63]PIE76380.1 MAG: isopentenyl-diphosphate delta-isomerase [bacterium DOLJORAL78_65_58]